MIDSAVEGPSPFVGARLAPEQQKIPHPVLQIVRLSAAAKPTGQLDRLARLDHFDRVAHDSSSVGGVGRSGSLHSSAHPRHQRLPAIVTVAGSPQRWHTQSVRSSAGAGRSGNDNWGPFGNMPDGARSAAQDLHQFIQAAGVGSPQA